MDVGENERPQHFRYLAFAYTRVRFELLESSKTRSNYLFTETDNIKNEIIRQFPLITELPLMVKLYGIMGPNVFFYDHEYLHIDILNQVKPAFTKLHI